MKSTARDGSSLWWGTSESSIIPMTVTPGSDLPLTVLVSPVKPGHSVCVQFRVNRGPIQQVTAVSAHHQVSTHAAMRATTFHASIPAQPSGEIELLPVLHYAGQPISPGLQDGVRSLRYRIEPGFATPDPSVGNPSGDPAGHGQLAMEAMPRWRWETNFLGALTVKARKESVGPTPDGLRITWHVVEGTYRGPGIKGIVLPGGGDWMRIRKDGIGIVDVRACLKTESGAMIYTSYGGICDFGPNGYERALRDEFDPLPPCVVTPTYATSDDRLEWINRAQCLGVGRIDMNKLEVQFDEYLVAVGDRITA